MHFHGEKKREKKGNRATNELEFYAVYLGTSRSCTSNFNKVIGEVATVCSRVDKLIANSAYLTSTEGRASLEKRLDTLHCLGPFSYLTSGCAGGIWEQCLNNFVSAFQETKVKAHEYLLCIENLKRHAAMLDKCIPEMTKEILKYDRVLPHALQNAECMLATLKGLVNIASQSFDLYKPRELSSSSTTICPFRGSGRSFTSTTTGSNILVISTLDRHPTAETHIVEPISSDISPTRFFLMSYPTLQAVTILVCLIATSLQLRAYALSSTPSKVAGHLSDSDFYNNLQSTLMQSLTTYTGLVPAIRVRALRGLISVLWVSCLSVAGLVLNFAAMGIYFHDAGMAPLLSFFGNVAQAVTVLHLAIRIERFVGLPETQET